MRNINILFWNIYKKDLSLQIVNICRAKEIDILILAENNIDTIHLVQKLNENSVDYFPNNPLSQCEKVTIITKFHFDYINPVYESHRFTIRHVNLPSAVEFLLTAVHLIDKGNHSDESQSEEATNTVSDINRVENDVNIEKNVVIGDFNMNPFEPGMIKTLGFHATMSSNIAKKISRTVQARVYKYFYNPMWSLLGDLNKTTAGSYYYRNAEHVNYEWNLFDQVLIRPTLIENFVKESLLILESDGVISLLDVDGKPNKTDYSDHLPIFFSLKV